MAAIDATATHLPDLQVVVASTHLGHAWTIDLDRSEVYVDGSASPDDWAAALLDALAMLCRHHDVPAPRRVRVRLRLVPSLRRAVDSTGTG